MTEEIKRDAAITMLIHLLASSRFTISESSVRECSTDALYLWLYSLGYRYSEKTNEWEAVLLTPASKKVAGGEQGLSQATWEPEGYILR